jgi:hypothetical protein
MSLNNTLQNITHMKIIKHMSVIETTNALVLSNCLLLKQKYFMPVNGGNLEQAESISYICSNTLQICFNPYPANMDNMASSYQC